jgi:H-type lectin domain
LYERNYKGVVSEVVDVRFTKQFKEKPELMLGLVEIDGGIGFVRVSVFAKPVTREGFTLHFKTWEDSRLDNATVSWMAIGR